MTTTTIRIDEPRELLALVPHHLGFAPVESVVTLSLRPPRGRLGMVARLDIAALADADDGPRIARSLIGHLDRDGAAELQTVVYTQQDPRGTSGHPALTAVRNLREAAEGLGPVTAWVVTATGYLNLDCAGECCPAGGRPLAELESTQVGARLVLAGSAVAGCRDDVAAIRRARGEARRAVSRARTRWSARGARAALAGPLELESWRLASVRAWREQVARTRSGAGSPTAPGLARVEAGLRDVRVRDALLAALVPGAGELPENLVRGVQSGQPALQGLSDALDRIYQPEHAIEPGPDAAVHVRVLEQVVAHGAADDQAPACTLLGVLAWWSGEGARANLMLERALHDDPAYRLAQLVDRAARGGLAPGWVRAAREAGGVRGTVASDRRRRGGGDDDRGGVRDDPGGAGSAGHRSR